MAKTSNEVNGWVGWIAFASVMMIVNGIFGMIIALTAILRDDFYLVTQNFIFDVDITVWGWVHFLLALVVMAAGFAILNGKMWGRVVGILVAGLSAIVNMYFIPYYPVWSLLVIVVDVFVIYALIVHGDQVKE